MESNSKCADKTLPSYWKCPNFKPQENDTSFDYEYYECKVCGQHGKLDYDEMR